MPIRMVITPELARYLPLGRISYVPLKPMGTTGTPALIARVIAPVLKGLSLPSMLRVPSGKIRTDVPFAICSAARFRLLRPPFPVTCQSE